jgi:hypothetical protein
VERRVMSVMSPFREWERPAWEEVAEEEDRSDRVERENPSLWLDRSAGSEVAPPDPLAAYSPEARRGAEETETDRAGRTPQDIATEFEDPALQAWTSEAYGVEPEFEGLTFYGREYEFGAPPEQEREDSAADSLKNLLAKGYWSAAVAFAILLGERDKNKLTNMLFWARHPELDGKKIPPGNKTLAEEWKAIYKTLVLPPLGPVSPSTVDPTAVPNEQKSVDTLIVDIFNSEQQVLTAWSGALAQFQVVMNAHSDAEGVADFVGAVMKHVGDQVISKIAGQVPGLSYAKGMLEKVTKEYERAREARTSAQLRDFLVRFTGSLTDAMNDLGRAFADYKHMVETAYAKAGPDEKKQYQKALADHLSSLDRNWTNVNNVFQLISQEWIRNTMYKQPAGWVTPSTAAAPAFVVISVNKDYSVRGVELHCQGGQKIAEQLLKNAGGTGLRPYAWPVPRRFLYFVDSGSWPSALINLTSDGRWVQQGSIDERAGSVVLEHIRKNGLEETTKVKGR